MLRDEKYRLDTPEVLRRHGVDFVEQQGRTMALMAVNRGPGEWHDVTDYGFGKLAEWLGY
jgi:hypothetical protein